jgi:phosphomannomutase
MMEPIKFGTDGWRDLIGRGFTAPRLRQVTRGLALWLRSRKNAASRQVLVGFDTRFLSRHFAREACLVLSSQGFEPILSDRVIPTPCISWNVRNRQAACGIVITSSHNTGQYNGFKIKLSEGCSAFEQETLEIERGANGSSGEPAPHPATVQEQDFLEPYLEALKARVDWPLLMKSRLKLVADSMHGAGGDILAMRLASGGLQWLPFRDQPDPLFGGVQPEPVGENMDALRREVVRQGAAAGIANDGDADRVGLVDEHGEVVNAHQLLGLLVEHLAGRRGQTGEVVKTFSGTQLVDRLCGSLGLRLHETPVGFKHIARVMLQREVLVGGEESNGFGFGDHLPERDGLLGALRIAEILAQTRLPLSRLIAELRQKHGLFHYDRLDLHLPGAKPEGIRSFLKTWQPASLAGRKVAGRSDLDGAKFLLGDSWLLLRPSGTEPLVRIYSEALSRQEVNALLAEGKEALRSFL